MKTSTSSTTKPLTLGSLFSGSGGFELGGELAGIKPVWASEVEPFPIAVTRKNFPEMEHLGDVCKINGADVEPVDIVTFGSPCFPAGTMVLTSNGYTPIEEIKRGDLVLTHLGRWRRVTSVGSTVKNTIELSGNFYGLECTPNHPIYATDVCFDYSRNRNTGKIISQARILSKDRQWVNASDMYHKYWATPNRVEPLNEDKPIPNNKEKPMPMMNEDFWYFVGRYIGDGWALDGQRCGRPEGQRCSNVFICDNHDKKYEIIDIVSKISNHYSVERCRTAVRVKCAGRLLCDWLVRNIGKKSRDKFISGWIFGIEEKYRKRLLQGIIDSDGHRDTHESQAYSISTSSKKLALSIRLLAESLGYSTTIIRTKNKPTCIIEGRTVNQSPYFYKIDITMSHKVKRLHDNYQSWYICRKVGEKSAKEKTVYNLSVEEDNSYIADSIVVHNCQNLSNAGTKTGLVGSKSSLFFQAIRIIKEMRGKTNGKYPRYAVFENVRGALWCSGGEDFRRILTEFCSVVRPDIAIPKPDKWNSAGCIMADDFSIAWRLLDASGWGVPQRRKRIYLVADFAGQSAPKILFEPEGLRWDSLKGEAPWQRNTTGIEDGSRKASGGGN